MIKDSPTEIAEYIKNRQGQNLSFDEFTSLQKQESIAVLAQDKSFKNARAIINTVDEGLDGLNMSMEDFTAGVKKSNPELAKVIESGKQGGKAMRSYGAELVKTKAAGLAASIGVTALNTALSIGASIIISGAISWITGLIQEQERLSESATEAATACKETAQSLSEESAKFLELRESLDSGNLGEKEAYDVRKQLYEMQQELIKTYGNEAAGIDLVNGSIDSQIQKYKDLLKVKLNSEHQKNSRRWDDSVDYITTMGWQMDDINSASERFASPNYDMFDSLAKERNNLKRIFKTSKGTDINIRYDEDFESLRFDIGDAIKTEGGGRKDLIETYDLIIERLSALKKAYESNPLYSGNTNLLKGIELIRDRMQEAKDYWDDEKYEENLEWFNQEALRQVLNNSEAYKMYSRLTDAQNAYKEAITSGASDKEISEKLTELHQAENIIKSAIEDGTYDSQPAIKEYFEDTLEEIIQEISSKEIILRLKYNKEGLDDEVKAALGAFGYGNKSTKDDWTSDEILQMENEDMIGKLSPASTKYTLEQIEAYNKLQNILKKVRVETGNSKLTLSEFLSVLTEVKTLNEESDATMVIKKSSGTVITELEALQSAYKTSYNVISEYNKTGILSLDNVKSLLALEPKYLNCLMTKNGVLHLNRKSYIELTKAMLEQYKISQQLSAIKELRAMETEKDANKILKKNVLDYTVKQGKNLEELWQKAFDEAAVKDAENGTHKYTKAVEASYKACQNQIVVIDAMENSLVKNADSTLGVASAENMLQENLKKSQDALEHQKSALEANKKTLEDRKSVLEKEQTDYENAKDAIQSLIDTTIEWIKQTKNDEIKALDKKHEALEKSIEKEKELLDAEKNRSDFEEELKSKQNALSSATLARTAASLDNSSAGKANFKKSQDDYLSAQSEMNSFMKDHSYEVRQEALDKFQEAENERYEKQKEKIEKYLEDERKIYLDACKKIDNMGSNLKQKLLGYWKEHTTKTTAEFNRMWSQASIALKKYGKLMTDGDDETASVYVLLNNLQKHIYQNTDEIEKLSNSIDKYSNKIENVSSKIDKVSKSVETLNNNVKSASSSYAKLTTNAKNAANATKEIETYKKQAKNNYEKSSSKKTKSKYRVVYKGKAVLVTASSKNKALKKAKSKLIDRFRDEGYPDVAAKLEDWSLEDLKKAVKNKSMKITSVVSGHKRGTRSSQGGIKRVDEEGAYSELIPYQAGVGRYVILPKNNPVFSKDMTNTLFDFASNPPSYLKNLVQNANNKTLNNKLLNNNSTVVNLNLQVSGDAKSAVSLLRNEGQKIVDNALSKIYKDSLFLAGRNKNRF